jgi:hypothetical protein
VFVTKKLMFTTSNIFILKSCPRETRTRRFVDVDRKSGSPEPINAGEDVYEPIPTGEEQRKAHGVGWGRFPRAMAPWRDHGDWRARDWSPAVHMMKAGDVWGSPADVRAVSLAGNTRLWQEVGRIEEKGKRTGSEGRCERGRGDRSRGAIGRPMTSVSQFLITSLGSPYFPSLIFSHILYNMAHA